MIANVTMQSIDGDCPSNIVVDVEKLKAITLDNCIKYYKDNRQDNKTKLRFAQERLEDAQRYVKIITGENVNDNQDIPNPRCWNILEEAKVELPQMINYTGVIFYGEK